MNKDYFNLMGLKTMNRSNNDGNDSDDFGAAADDDIDGDDDDSVMQMIVMIDEDNGDDDDNFDKLLLRIWSPWLTDLICAKSTNKDFQD